MLTAQTIEIVKSTIPLLAEHGQAITQHFYQKLLSQSPELKNVFNLTNQADGDQSRALADAVFAYANNIDNIEVLVPAVQRIAHKHVSLGIKAEQYPIIGAALLASIQEVLSLPDDHPALSAWGEAYGVLADIFIQTEESLYQSAEQASGGWRGFREFVIDNIVSETEQVKSFYLKPKDNGALPAFKGGQYIGIKVSPEKSDYEQIRQYSLSGQSGQEQLRITTKAELNGLVSTHMHKSSIGDTLLVQVPAGVFNLDLNAKKHIFIAGGVGLTPLLGMLYDALNSGINASDILFIQCQLDQQHQICRQELAQLQTATGFNFKTSFMEGDQGDHQGYLNTKILQQWFTDFEHTADTAVYLCGPKAFMSELKRCCLSLGVEDGQIHYETFGPTSAI